MNPFEVYKNKASGKHFIYIDDAGNNEALFVTPEGKIKCLEKSLFEGPTTEDEGTITELQAERYREYIKGKQEDAKDRFKRKLEEMSPSELVEFQRYIDGEMEARRKFRHENKTKS